MTCYWLKQLIKNIEMLFKMPGKCFIWKGWKSSLRLVFHRQRHVSIKKKKEKKRKKESNLFLLSKCCVSASSKLSPRICILNPRLCQKFNSLKLNPNLASTKRTDSKRSSKDLTKAVFEEKILTRQSCTRINQNTF